MAARAWRATSVTDEERVMRRRALLLGLGAAFSRLSAAGAATRPAATETSVLSGTWTYRSFHDRAAPVDDSPRKALSLIFAEALFTFDVAGHALTGRLDWPGGGLDLSGSVQQAEADGPLSVAIVGSGRVKTSTQGWQYDYRASLAYRWPNGVNQIPALLGTVIRTKPHSGAPAGYVASFIPLKHA
jgi:hypothetical protein